MKIDEVRDRLARKARTIGVLAKTLVTCDQRGHDCGVRGQEKPMTSTLVAVADADPVGVSHPCLSWCRLSAESRGQNYL